MYELYIKGRKVDLPSTTSINWTFNASDLSAPSAIKNNFSKQIELDGTPNNNIVFNYLYKLDADYSIQFNPNIRNEFVLTSNGVYVESGYVQLNSIKKNKDQIKYAITLFGGLGDFFYNLDKDETGNKKSLFDLHWRWVDSIDLDTNWWQDDRFGSLHNVLSKDQEDDQLILSLSPKNIVLSWKELDDPSSLYTIIDGHKYTNVRNDIILMPFDSGMPDIEGFDATKLLIDTSIYNNNLNGYWQNEWNTSFPDTLDGTRYYAKTVRDNYGEIIGNFILTESQRDISQLETGMLINTQMIPGIRMKKLIEVISDKDNNGGYDVEYSSGVLNNPIMQDQCYMLLDRIKTDDINLALVVKDDVETDIGVNWKGTNKLYGTSTIRFLSGDTVEKSQIVALGIDSLVWNCDRTITTNANVLIGGYTKTTHIGDHPYYDRADLPGFILCPQYISEIYPSSDPLDYRIIRHIYGCKANVNTYYRNLVQDVDDSQKKIHSSYMNNFNTLELTPNNQLFVTNKKSKLCNPVSYSVTTNTLDAEYPNDRDILLATIYINILRITDLNEYNEVVYAYPWILVNNINYKAEDSRDPNTYTEYYDNVIPAIIPDIIDNWIHSNDFTTALHNYIDMYLAADGYNKVAVHIDDNIKIIAPNTSNFTDIPQSLGTHSENAYRSYTLDNPPGQTGIEKHIFAYEEFKLNISQKLTNHYDINLDLNEISQLGNEYKFGVEYTWCNLDKTNNVTTVNQPTSNHPTNYFWLPASFHQCLDKTIYTNLQHDVLASVGAFPVSSLPSKAYVAPNATGGSYNFTFGHEIFEKTIFPPINSKLTESYTRKSAIFNGTNSPYEYFISLAKMLGWKFDYDAVLKKVMVMTSQEYYNINNPIPLTIDYGKEQTITPYLMDASIINLSLEPIDSYGNYLYNKQTDSNFNSVDIPNKYSFNDKTENLLEKVVFQTGSEYIPSSPMFTPNRTFVPITLLGGTTQYRYPTAQDDGNYELTEIRPRVSTALQNNVIRYDYPMLNCYDSDYSYSSTKNILVFLNGFISNIKLAPNYENSLAQVYPTYFGVTSYVEPLKKLNDGNPCYVNNFYYNPNAQTCPWAITNSISVWPSDIPYFTLYNFLDFNYQNYNGENNTKYSSLLFNPNGYYPLNSEYNISLRLKSKNNATLGNSIIEPFESWPLNYPVTSNYNLYAFNTPRMYNVEELNSFATNAINSNFYSNNIANITDTNARQIKLKAKLNTTPKNALHSIYKINGGIYLISKIENYDISQVNPFADITLQKIINV